MHRFYLALCAFLMTVGLAASATAATVQLAWDPNPELDIAGYVVHYGTSPGVYPWSVDVGNRTTYGVSGLAGGQRYDFAVRVYNVGGLRSNPSAEVSDLVVSSVPAQITSPPIDSTLTGTTQTFSWNRGTGVSAYWLDVGTTQGGYNVFQGFVGTSQSWSVSGLPTSGGAVWVRLRSLIDGAYQVRDHRFVAANAASRIVSPVVGSTLGGSTQTFTWNAGIGVQFYWLNVGTSAGDYDVYSGFVGNTHAAVISNIPVNGRPVWVRLMSYINGQYRAVDHQFIAAMAGPAQIVSPAVGSVLDGTSHTFTWNSGVGASFYSVNVGTTQGGYELCSDYVGTSRSLTVSGLPIDGRAVWVRLMSYINGAYQFVDHRFVADTPGPARVTSPAAGAGLSGATQTFAWNPGVNVSFYWVNVGRTQGGYELYSNYVGNSRTLTLTNLPIDGGAVWVRLMLYINGAYQHVDHRFAAALPTPARLVSPVTDEALFTPAVTFAWDAGVGVSFHWLNVGTSQGGYDLFSNYVGTEHAWTVSGLPINGQDIWVRLHSRIGDTYVFVDYRFRTAP